MSLNNKNQCQYTIDKLKSLVKKVCFRKQISQYHFRFGPKKYTQHQFVGLLILYAKSGKSLRKFVESLYESKWPELLKLKEIPSKSSIHRHFERIGLTIIRSLNKMVVKTTESLHYAIDSTGIDSNYASKHYEKRIGRTHRPYIKLSIIGQTTKPFIVEDFEITDKHCNDAKHIKPILKRFNRKNKIIFADKGYDAENLHQIVNNSNNYLYSPIRDFKVKKPKGIFRRKMDKIFEKDIYHERNKIETIMFLIKHHGIVIRAKKRSNKIKELAWKILSYNILRIAKAINLIIFYMARDNTLY